MARIKFTALVESIRGTIAGTTFQANAYGFTAKRKSNNIRPVKPRQIARQKNAQIASGHWRALSQADRDAWQAYSQSFPIAARLNPDSNLNGYNYFLKYHNLLQLVGENTFLDNPGATQVSFTWTPDDLLLDAIAGDLTFSGVLDDGGHSWHALLYAGPIVPASQIFLQVVPRFQTFDSTANDPAWELGQSYINQFGQLPAVGDNVALRVVLLSQTTGQMAFIPAQQFEVIAA